MEKKSAGRSPAPSSSPARIQDRGRGRGRRPRPKAPRRAAARACPTSAMARPFRACWPRSSVCAGDRAEAGRQALQSLLPAGPPQRLRLRPVGPGRQSGWAAPGPWPAARASIRSRPPSSLAPRLGDAPRPPAEQAALRRRPLLEAEDRWARTTWPRGGEAVGPPRRTPGLIVDANEASPAELSAWPPELGPAGGQADRTAPEGRASDAALEGYDRARAALRRREPPHLGRLGRPGRALRRA